MQLTPRTGNRRPRNPDTVVMYALPGEPGVVRIEKVSALHWGRGLGDTPTEGRIAGWRVLVAAPSREHIAEGTPLLHCGTVIVA